ncbi:hypothetical protein C5167_049786 [Papaver somniferum]|uniref:RING-type domain-containing protein n=2 Tax=Papaver somniferum TaxID=3469 RepID=A0A4Y7KPI5_PAPSO|nr:hypothetical protein C5167_049786 [Papaver somniferum]
MILLFVVSILVLVIYLYIKFVVRRQARAQQHIQLGDITGNPYSDNPVPPKSGLEPSTIASLPIYVHKQTDDNSSCIECAVCLVNLEEEEEEIARILPNCNHVFHAKCIDVWLISHSTCPICRTEADPGRRTNSTGVDVQAGQPSAVVIIS